MRAKDARRSRLLPVLVAALAAACWGDVVPVWPDGYGGTDSDTGSGESAQPIPGGGLAGGKLDGRLDLFLLHEETLDPVPGARVLLPAGGAPLTATTDFAGHAVFVDAGLEGSADLHVLAEGFVAESFLGLETAEATLLMRPVAKTPPPQAAVVSGIVGGLAGLPAPTATQRRAVLVAFGPRWADLASSREPLVGFPVPRTIVEVDDDNPSFELEVPPVPGVVHFFAGLVETYGTDDPMDDTYSWRLFGALPGVEPQPGETIAGLEANVDQGLLVSFHAQPGAFPSAYERADIQLVLDLGHQGTVWIPGTRQGGKWAFDAPERIGVLAASAPFLIARGDQAQIAEDGAGCVEATPLGRYIARDLGSLVEYSPTSPFVVPGMPSPPAQVGFDGQRFQCLSTAGTDLGQVVISDALTGAEHWRITAFGDLPGAVDLPPFPGDWGFSGIPETALVVRAWTATFALDPAELHFASYPQLVREVAFEAAEVGPAR